MGFVDWIILYSDDHLAARACFALSLPVLLPVALTLKFFDRILKG